MLPPPDIRLYHSNALEVLAELLAEELRTPVPGQALLQPDTILIPQAAIKRWLQARLAGKYGIAANLEFLTPGEWVARALDANVARAEPGEDFGADSLHWRLYAALSDVERLQHPALQPLAAYLDSASRTPDLARHDPARNIKPGTTWALAGELAATFEKYQAWRRDWLLQWEEGINADHAQAVLWQQIAGGRRHRARRIHDYLHRFAPLDGPRPTGLPKRLFAFAILSVSPDVLRVIATQARVGSLHLYVPSPTADNWGDLLTRQQQRQHQRDVAAGRTQGLFAAPPSEHRLLQAWGQAGRDFMWMLGADEGFQNGMTVISATVDPRLDTRSTLAEGGLSDSLLQRVQGDLFHRESSPSGVLRETLWRDDPSVQFHACHTRLRELQVLHDQVCALLDDPRFKPPLEPREIAVLAPDISLYAPWLASVFGVAGEPGHLPWTLADTAPLGNEPLAQGFLQLIDLPHSRFGVHELMDLIASTPLAASVGLEPDTLERLRAWLVTAGARWGFDGEHRRAHEAPEDAAYTWQFALDRLLLGHATGAETVLEGEGGIIAPWPELEGGALDALGQLLELLDRLNALRRSLDTPATADAWQQRLLHLLETLLPEALISPATGRLRERLAQHIHSFARSARQAGFSATVPLEVVQAWFSSVLHQADTRAPLLTGGISFGRMVPMRLLPFRVICVLGMNDGQFPHRDPASGLNRMLAELHDGRRRAGDRSTRDDDRFLFLQLLLAAQDVFYLSWLGADPRDGSAREPSVLVSEWLDAVAACHTEPAAARKALVVQHPLQPFSPAAFGDGHDPRRFSYSAQWSPAAAPRAAVRQPVPPWFTPPLPAPSAQTHDSLPLDALRRFLSDPAGQFLRQRLGLRLDEAPETWQDIEPLTLLGRSQALDAHRLRQHLLHALVQGEDAPHPLYQRLLAQALLPAGALGEQQFQVVLADIRPCADAFRRWHDGEPLQTLTCAVEIDGQHLHGEITDVHPLGLVRLAPGPPGAGWVVRTGLDWLLANAVGHTLPLLQFHANANANATASATANSDADSYGPHPLPALPAAQARAALKRLLQLRTNGLHTPLPFAPYTGWAIWNAAADKRIEAARSTWQGSSHSWGECDEPAQHLLWRGQDPLAAEASVQHWIDTSMQVFSALRAGLG